MLEIVINNESLDLGPKPELKLTLRSKILNPDDKGSYAFDFRFPDTPKNQRILKHANKLEVADIIEYDNVLLKFKRAPLYTCRLLLLQSGKNQSFRASIIVESEASIFTGLSLSDVDMGTVTGYSDLYLYMLDANQPETNPGLPVTFPMLYMPNFYADENNRSYSGYVNAHAEDLTLANNVDWKGDVHNYTSFVPCLYLHYVLEKIADHLGYSISGDFMSNEDLKKLIIPNNTGLDTLEGVSFFEGYHNADFLFEYTSGSFSTLVIPSITEDADNAWDNVNFRYEIQQEGKYIISYFGKARNDPSIVAESFDVTFKIKIDGVDFGEETFTTLNTTYTEIEYYKETEFIPAAKIGTFIEVFVLFDSSTGDHTGKLRNEILTIKCNDSYLNIEPDEFDLNRHLPDITLDDFFDKLASTFMLDIDIDVPGKIIRMNFVDDIFKKKAKDISDRVNCEYETRHAKNGLSFQYGYRDLYSDFKESIDDSSLIIFYDNREELGDDPLTIGETHGSIISDEFYTGEEDQFKIKRYKNKGEYRLNPVVYGDGDKSIEPGITPWLMKDQIGLVKHVDTVNNYYHLTPYSELQGRLTAWGQDGDELPFSLLFFRGFQFDSAEFEYPLATDDVREYTSDVIVGAEFSFRLKDETYGIYHKLHKKILDMMYDGREVDFISETNIEDLSLSQFRELVHINGQNFLIKERQVFIEGDKLKLSKIKTIHHAV